MFEDMHQVTIAIVLAPLIGAIIAGLFGSSIGRKGAHRITILGVAIACSLSIAVFKHIILMAARVSTKVFIPGLSRMVSASKLASWSTNLRP